VISRSGQLTDIPAVPGLLAASRAEPGAAECN
jgi:hypothetical protein